jgi:hypothetical protein
MAIICNPKLGWLMATLPIIFLHDFVSYRAWGILPEISVFADSPWTWSGKIYSTLFILALAALSPLGLARSGATLRFREGVAASSAAAAALALIISLAALLLVPNEPATLDELLFQLTMPGIEEELFYRGLLLAMLNEAFGRPVRIFGAPFGWGAVVAAIFFASAHGVSVEHGVARFSSVPFAATFASALIFAWFREKTGNLIFPILIHNFGNVAFLVL